MRRSKNKEVYMAGTQERSSITATKEKKRANAGYAVRSMGELLIVAGNDDCRYTDITTPLTRNNINMECFTTYRWGNETAFRIVTSDNRKARELLKFAGFEVQEHPVTLWYTKNEPGRFNKAADALARANIETYCTYSTSSSSDDTMIIAFDTNDTAKTSEVLCKIR